MSLIDCASLLRARDVHYAALVAALADAAYAHKDEFVVVPEKIWDARQRPSARLIRAMGEALANKGYQVTWQLHPTAEPQMVITIPKKDVDATEPLATLVDEIVVEEVEKWRAGANSEPEFLVRFRGGPDWYWRSWVDFFTWDSAVDDWEVTDAVLKFAELRPGVKQLLNDVTARLHKPVFPADKKTVGPCGWRESGDATPCARLGRPLGKDYVCIAHTCPRCHRNMRNQGHSTCQFCAKRVADDAVPRESTPPKTKKPRLTDGDNPL